MIDFDAEVLAACQQEFGRQGFYQAAGGEAMPIVGIFTDGYKSPIIGGDGMPAWTTSAPTFCVRASDLRSSPTKSDRVIIDGKQYVVMDARPDGVGWIVLPLKVAA
ncbi:MAG: hypothetical protein GAK35_03394 [Herbaspirillum frisingense]|uniref:Head-tail adaptor protein n=1 Tax=Herbaspirillum frisingense TaxID=92645 RepID=A0A7V8FUD4_9BURK|nr:MAG: hypothetical protein GAK35_03394 [Herbaspirillum frisingense]